jgi:hypothetical protein
MGMDPLEVKLTTHSLLAPRGTFAQLASYRKEYTDSLQRYYYEVPGDVNPLSVLVQFSLACFDKDKQHKGVRHVYHLAFSGVPYEIEVKAGMWKEDMLELERFVKSHAPGKTYPFPAQKIAESFLSDPDYFPSLPRVQRSL